MTKYVYMFSEGNATMRSLLGGKGANLAEMTRIGLNVPQGFTITTEACNLYRQSKKFPDGLWDQIKNAINDLEKISGKELGSSEKPLLVSIRSGAEFSMPGMMDTVLNLGLNQDTMEALAQASNNKRFSMDCYRRLIQMFGDVVLDIDIDNFEGKLENAKKQQSIKLDLELNEDSLSRIISEYQQIIKDKSGKDFPTDPMVQLEMAIKAVFESWDNPRAITYRKMNGIANDLGTAVNVQAMVFGNIGERSATGVAFTRNPGNGNKEYYGEYLMNAQGEDVVAGIRTPRPVSEMGKEMPDIYKELTEVYSTLERHYKDMQDFEFTIENGQLHILQTRNGKRTAQAAIKIAIDMEEEGLITKEQALLMVNPQQLAKLLHRSIDPKAEVQVAAEGLPASPGAASGKVVFTADDAVQWNEKGEKVLLVRVETKPDDIHGFFASEGILTARGGKTSHAAVVARGIGKPCVSGCETLSIDVKKKQMTIGQTTISEGETITIDGTAGNVILGMVPTVEPDLSPEAVKLLNWADEVRELGVWANASMPETAKQARKFGAEGIGLCRTERMFNAAERHPIVVEMILAETLEERMTALDKLLPFQRKDFSEIFQIMEGLPVVIRLLDIPLHEFLPSIEELNQDIIHLNKFQDWLNSMSALSGVVGMMELPNGTGSAIKNLSAETELLRDEEAVCKVLERKRSMLRKVRKLEEVNPMLGHRGVRLGITYPEIYRMQIRAICEAAASLIKGGKQVQPHIMIPQVCTADELKWTYELLLAEKEKLEKKLGIDIPVKLGTMIEVVRACMRAGRIAERAEFFSFGTNDLTQAVFSFSREDAENTFLPLYNQRKILADNPFEILDHKGVGQLMQITVEWGRKTRPDLKIGICGEHGGEPRSIGFVHTIGVDYVSCSPFRVPVARLAAAQAALRNPEELSQIWSRTTEK